MKSRSTSVIVAAVAAMISASPAPAGGLKQVVEISIPGDPITDIGIMAIDQTTGRGYLADKTNKSGVVFDTKTDKFVARIPGFVGRLKDGNASGPNGVVVVKGGAEVWVSRYRSRSWWGSEGFGLPKPSLPVPVGRERRSRARFSKREP
jgi:hypothetical protein